MAAFDAVCGSTLTFETRARIRVAFVMPSFAGGGAERVLITFANMLDPARFQVAMVVLDDRGPLRNLLEGHVRLHRLRRARARQALPRLISLLRRMAPDVVVASAPQLNHPLLGLRWLLPRSTRVVVREANLPSKVLPFSRFKAVFSCGLRWLYPNADLVLATSHRMREELRGLGVSSDRIAVVPNPVDVDRIRAMSQPSTRVAGPGCRYVAVGRLVPQKGFDRLIPLLTQLKDDSHLAILGEGVERRALESLIVRYGLVGRVALPGFVDNPWSWLAGADALVMPSHTEGMPNVALEALACGTPVIATPASGGLVEIAGTVSPGAVKVVPFEQFRSALREVPEQGRPQRRPSNLPRSFHGDQAKDVFEQSLAGVTLAPRPPRNCGIAGLSGLRLRSRTPR